jgi:hypothetical protein
VDRRLLRRRGLGGWRSLAAPRGLRLAGRGLSLGVRGLLGVLRRPACVWGGGARTRRGFARTAWRFGVGRAQRRLECDGRSGLGAARGALGRLIGRRGLVRRAERGPRATRTRHVPAGVRGWSFLHAVAA